MEIIRETPAEGLGDNRHLSPLKIHDTADKKKSHPEKHKKTTGGAAISRMQEIAQSIYDSTPNIQDDLPRNTSKILQNVKVDKNKQNPLSLLKMGPNGLPDPTNEMLYEDW